MSIPSEVIVYSTPLCAPCEQLKRYLKAMGISFMVKDLLMDEEAAELLESKNIHSAPALQVNGELYAGEQLAPENIDALFGLQDN
ncbi:MAG: glutaredoxin family protein [SAR324 cluster bacterium]|nr:glutaredoxin family protein [SAR324 cluster bacterium]